MAIGRPPEQRLPQPLARVFGSLDDHRVRWSLLRPPEGLAGREGDVDVLVEAAALPVVRAVAARSGFVRVPRTGPDLHAVDYEAGQDRFVWLHVQTQLRLGTATVPAARVLENLDHDPFPHPPEDWMLWILILHGILDKGDVATRHRTVVQRLAARANPAPAELAAVAIRHGVEPERLRTAAAAGDWETLRRLAPAPQRPALRDRVAGTLGAARGAWARRGLGVAVIGPDGAGKSTLVAGLATSLPFPTRVIYMGLTGGRLPRADALRVPGLVLAARMALLWARYVSGVYHRAHGRVVVFDRYTLDAGVPPPFAQRRGARLSRRIQGAACPLPDVVFLLDASGATLHRRSAEYDADTLGRWSAAFRRIAGRRDAVVVLDAERPAAAVLRDARARVWERYRARWMAR